MCLRTDAHARERRLLAGRSVSARSLGSRTSRGEGQTGSGTIAGTSTDPDGDAEAAVLHTTSAYRRAASATSEGGGTAGRSTTGRSTKEGQQSVGKLVPPPPPPPETSMSRSAVRDAAQAETFD